MSDTTIANKIKNYRKEQNMTQEELSKKSGINISTIKKYETRNRNPKYEQLAKIASALGININTFFDLEVNTISDILSLLIKLDKSTDIKWNVIKDEYGKIIPDSISLSFSDEEINNALATYLSNKETHIKKNEESGSIDYSLNIDEWEITVEKKSF